eukprot:m.21244 g.21244  ORF g.21244 m.21244 type:complete len:90 (+) comp8702_c0_seq1:2409-2678(+)
MKMYCPSRVALPCILRLVFDGSPFDGSYFTSGSTVDISWRRKDMLSETDCCLKRRTRIYLEEEEEEELKEEELPTFWTWFGYNLDLIWT